MASTLRFGGGTRTVYSKVKDARWPSLTVMDSTSKDPQRQVTLSAYPLGKYGMTNKECCDVLNWALAQGYPKTSVDWDSNFNDCRSTRYANIAPTTSNATLGLRLAGSN